MDARNEANDLEELAALDFLSRFVADRERGTPRPLTEHLVRAPRFERRIAEEWLRLQGVGVDDEPGLGAAPAAATADAAHGYHIVRELGRGGQGIVYLAHDDRMGRDVALKLLRGDGGALSTANALRFEREVAAIARLDHPCLCSVFAAGGDAAGRWIAMKFVDGPSLEARLVTARAANAGAPRERAAIDAAVLLIERLAEGLAHAHAAGLVHRDIKPGNVLIAADETPVLVDFGLARVEASDPGLTMPGTVPGTMSYLAPELLRDRRADARSDLWSLGACLYELLTLQRPFAAATIEGELRARATQPIVDVRRLNPAVPKDLAAVVATAVAVEPERRYASAAAFAADLRRYRRREPVHARRAGLLLVLRRWAQRSPGLATSLAALAAVVVVAFVVTLNLLRDTREALADVTRLSDLDACAKLIDAAGKLYPLREERIGGSEGMDAWLRDATSLLDRRTLHERALARLAATPPSESTPWQKDQLDHLLLQLDALATKRDLVTRNREFARTICKRSLDDHADEWRATCAAITASKHYRGLVLTPQIGLVPIGPDPDSGLFEFAVLESGEVPKRDPATARLVHDAASAIVLVLLPGGACVLGDEKAARAGADVNVDAGATDGEGPCYPLTLRPFFLAKFELTQGQWQRHTGTNPSNYKSDSTLETITDENPVEQVSWADCERVLREMSLTMPTEAQWEYAARGGTRTPYAWGGDKTCLSGHANIADADAHRRNNYADWPFEEWLHDGHVVHAPVGSYDANAFGLFDMIGNLKEWCLDSWEEYAEVPPRQGDGYRFGRYDKYRVTRGGSFSSDVNQARSGYRMGVPWQARLSDIGVRVARGIEP